MLVKLMEMIMYHLHSLINLRLAEGFKTKKLDPSNYYSVCPDI